MRKMVEDQLRIFAELSSTKERGLKLGSRNDKRIEEMLTEFEKQQRELRQISETRQENHNLTLEEEKQ